MPGKINCVVFANKKSLVNGSQLSLSLSDNNMPVISFEIKVIDWEVSFVQKEGVNSNNQTC